MSIKIDLILFLGIILSAAPAMAERCQECHDLRTAGLFVHAPLTEGQCMNCHGGSDDPDAPHAGFTSPYEIANTICLECHPDHNSSGNHRTDIPFKTKKDNPLPDLPLVDGQISCVTCHNPHAADENGLLRLSYMELCNACHIGYAAL